MDEEYKYKTRLDALRYDFETCDNAKQLEAFKAVFEGRDNLFITGKAGSGKTTFMRKILPFLKDCVVLAPTGVAALNAGGKTIHSFFKLSIEPYIPVFDCGELGSNTRAYMSKDDRRIVKKIKTIIIDEISMVRPDLLDRVADVLRSIRAYKSHTTPFAGVRLIMFGDLNQLPPVVKEDEMMHDYYDTRYFFSSYALRNTGFRVIQFDKIYRQSDPRFVNVLNDLRNGVISGESKSILDSRVMYPTTKSYTTLCAFNKQVIEINNRMLDRLDGKPMTFLAEKIGSMPKDLPCEDMITLKEGCRVMITVNDPIGRYVNGTTGIVESIEYDKKDKGNVRVFVRKDGTNESVCITRFTWDNSEYSLEEGKVVGRTIGTVTQLPLKIGYALSIHKSQGITLDSAYIDASCCFESGQAYVALSRCRTLEGLFLMKPITEKALVKDDDLIVFKKLVSENGGVFHPEPVKELESEWDAKHAEVLIRDKEDRMMKEKLFEEQLKNTGDPF